MLIVVYVCFFQPQKIAQELSDLVIYCQPMGLKSFEIARQTGSLQEQAQQFSCSQYCLTAKCGMFS